AGILADERGRTDLTGWNTSLIEINASGNVVVRSPYYTTGAGTVSLDEWHHVVWRYDKSTYRLEGFIDGVKSGAYVAADRYSPIEAGYGQYIGFGLGDWNAYYTSDYFSGEIRDIRVWNIARSDSAIVADMHRG